MFRGNVVAAGPAGEADFTTAWYWVRQVARNLAAANVRDYYTLKPGGWHVRALNVLEVGTGPDGDGIHGILRKRARDAAVPQRIVDVTWNRGEQQWEFSSWPGAILPWYALDVECLDSEGCVPTTAQFHKVYGGLAIHTPETVIPTCT